MEGATQPLADTGAAHRQAGYGIEIVRKVNDIPKGSRLAVSTNLLACLIGCACATSQIPPDGIDRRRGPAAGGGARFLANGWRQRRRLAIPAASGLASS